MLGGVADILSEQGAGASTYKRNNDHPFFAMHPKYHFVMDNHVTTNSFFTATQYGCQDFCNLTVLQLTGPVRQTRSSPRWSRPWRPRSRPVRTASAYRLIDNTAFNT